MAKKEWELVGFRLPPAQAEQLDAFIDESGEYGSKQEYLHQLVLEDIEDVELPDPRDELESVRQQRREVVEEVDEIRSRLDELEERESELRGREQELEREIEESATVGVQTYEDAVRGAAEEIVERDKRIIEKSNVVTQIADEWQEDKMTVLRDIYEADPRIRSNMIASHKGDVPRDDWQYRTGEDPEEAVELVRRYIDARADGGVRPPRDDYIQQVADDHDNDLEELTREAVEGIDHEFEDVVFGF